MNKRIENFIGGKFNKSENDTIPIYNPQEGKIIAEVVDSSNDDLDFVKSQYLSDSFEKYLKIIFVLEKNQTFVNQYPYCEPQLGNKGLYNTKGGFQKNPIQKNAINWILNFSDGKNSLLDIAIRSGINFEEINFAKEKLVESKLLKLSK